MTHNRRDAEVLHAGLDREPMTDCGCIVALTVYHPTDSASIFVKFLSRISCYTKPTPPSKILTPKSNIREGSKQAYLDVLLRRVLPHVLPPSALVLEFPVISKTMNPESKIRKELPEGTLF